MKSKCKTSEEVTQFLAELPSRLFMAKIVAWCIERYIEKITNKIDIFNTLSSSWTILIHGRGVGIVSNHFRYVQTAIFNETLKNFKFRSPAILKYARP